MKVKVQRAVAGDPNFLIYNRRQSVMFEEPIVKHPELATLMAGCDKRYFEAHVDGEGKLSIDGVVEDADW